jgi:hypothetical protein
MADLVSCLIMDFGINSAETWDSVTYVSDNEVWINSVFKKIFVSFIMIQCLFVSGEIWKGGIKEYFLTGDRVWIRTNVVLGRLCEDINCGGHFTMLWHLRWMGQLQRMDDARNTRKIRQDNLHDKRTKRRPKARWKYYAQNDVRKMGIVNWRKVAQDRDGWRRATGEVLIFLG